jgi:hypothetical protein
MLRPFALASVAVALVACAVAPETHADLSGTFEKSVLTGRWMHRVIVLGAISGPAVLAGAERTDEIRFGIDEDYVGAWREADPEPVLALGVFAHLEEDGTTRVPPVSACGDLVCRTSCETAEGDPCSRWYERPRIRVDTARDLATALPIPGTIEPIPCTSDCDAAPVPDERADGTVVWTIEADYRVTTCDVPSTCTSIVRARHELHRITH